MPRIDFGDDVLPFIVPASFGEAARKHVYLQEPKSMGVMELNYNGSFSLIEVIKLLRMRARHK